VGTRNVVNVTMSSMCSVMNLVRIVAMHYYSYVLIVSGQLLLLLVIIHCITSNSSLLDNLIVAQKQFIAFTRLYCFLRHPLFLTKIVFSHKNQFFLKTIDVAQKFCEFLK